MPAVVGVAATVALAAAAVYAKALTVPAGAAAATFGAVIVVLAGFPYLILVVVFVVLAVLATRYRFDEKRSRNVQEGRQGERGVPNVLAHIIVPTALVIVAAAVPSVFPEEDLALLFTAALAFGMADTLASEFGVLSGHARSLLTGRPVTPGTNGGVSATGEAWAFAGALVTAAAGLGLFLVFGYATPGTALLIGGATLSGFIGCQVDSVFGETLENPGYLTNGWTNFLAMVSTVLIASGLLLAFSP